MHSIPRLTTTCNECTSLYYADTSAMSGLCPECAHLLYSHPNCKHRFEAGRCTICFWDGSTSAYTAKLKQASKNNQ